MKILVPLVLTENENGDSIEDGSNVGEQPHDHSQLVKRTNKEAHRVTQRGEASSSEFNRYLENSIL